MQNQPHPPDSTNELTRRFGAIYTGAIVDVLDELGLPNQALPYEITPIREGMRVAGPAFPIEGRPHPDMQHEDSMLKILEMLGEAPAGHVCVYQTHDTTSSHLGELSVVALKARGCVGAVIDGGCRDIRHILSEDFPVFCRYTTPIDAVGRWEVTGFGREVFIAGIRVRAGDYIVADLDGSVVIPLEVCDEVLQRSEAVAHTENLVRDAVRAGMTPIDAYRQHGRF